MELEENGSSCTTGFQATEPLSNEGSSRCAKKEEEKKNTSTFPAVLVECRLR